MYKQDRMAAAGGAGHAGPSRSSTLFSSHPGTAGVAGGVGAAGGAGHAGPASVYEKLRDVSYIFRDDNDTTNYRYFLCVIHGGLPRNDQNPIERVPPNTIFLQPGRGDYCGQAIYTHAYNYFTHVLKTQLSRRAMFSYLLGHFGLDPTNDVLSPFAYNVSGEEYVDKVLSLTEKDTDYYWGVQRLVFNNKKQLVKLRRNKHITDRVRDGTIKRNSDLVSAINTEYPCDERTKKEANIIIVISCTVGLPSRPVRETRRCTGAYCEVNPSDYMLAYNKFGEATWYSTQRPASLEPLPNKVSTKRPPKPSSDGYTAALEGYIDPEEMGEMGVKSTNNWWASLPENEEYENEENTAPPRLPAPKPKFATCVNPPGQPGWCEWLSKLVGATPTATATPKVKTDRKRSNRVTMRRRRRNSRSRR